MDLLLKTAAFKNSKSKHDSYNVRWVGRGVRKALRQLWSRCMERIGITKAGYIVGSAREIEVFFSTWCCLGDRDRRRQAALYGHQYGSGLNLLAALSRSTSPFISQTYIH